MSAALGTIDIRSTWKTPEQASQLHFQELTKLLSEEHQTPEPLSDPPPVEEPEDDDDDSEDEEQEAARRPT